MKYLALSIFILALVILATCRNETQIDRNAPERATIDSIISIHAAIKDIEPDALISTIGLDMLDIVEIGMETEEALHLGYAIDVFNIYNEYITVQDFGDALQEAAE